MQLVIGVQRWAITPPKLPTFLRGPAPDQATKAAI